MSTSIYGYVEIKKFDSGLDDWFSVIDVGIAMTGNYDIFGCLCGVRNYANFEPLFPSRGLPSDCSDEIVSEVEQGDYHSATWCTFRELQEIDLKELSVEPDQRFLGEEKTKKGIITVKRFPSSEEEYKKRKYLSRGDALNDQEYLQLMELMKVLAKRYGAEGVRMVVYFD